jgi:hypothetical protein
MYVILVIQHATHMCRVILSCGLSGSAMFFLIISITEWFSGKGFLNIKRVFWFHILRLSITFLILRRNKRDIIMNVHTSSCEVPLFLSDFNETWIFSIHFRKILKYQIPRESVQWETSCSLRTDGRTDMTKLLVALGNFVNAPKNLILPTRSIYVWNVRFALQTAICTSGMMSVTENCGLLRGTIIRGKVNK